MDLNMHYSVSANCKQCVNAEKFDVCVIKSDEYNFER